MKTVHKRDPIFNVNKRTPPGIDGTKIYVLVRRRKGKIVQICSDADGNAVWTENKKLAELHAKMAYAEVVTWVEFQKEYKAPTKKKARK
jgi:hypothetical protein